MIEQRLSKTGLTETHVDYYRKFKALENRSATVRAAKENKPTIIYPKTQSKITVEK